MVTVLPPKENLTPRFRYPVAKLLTIPINNVIEYNLPVLMNTDDLVVNNVGSTMPEYASF